MVLPQALTKALRATGTVKLIPRTPALIAVQRQAAASKSANPSSTAQQSPYGGVPTTTLTNPRTLTHAPSFNVSLGQKGLTGGAFGDEFGFGLICSHEPQALLNVARRSRERMKMVAESFLSAMVLSLSLWLGLAHCYRYFPLEY